jgi:hypothetical protein
MGKKSEKKAREASLTYVAIGLTLMACALAGAACVLPYWLHIPARTDFGWSPRNIGLLQVSIKYTNTMLISADTTWVYLYQGVCNLAMSKIGVMGTGMGTAISGALVSAAGASCKETCKQNLLTRCTMYKIMAYCGLGMAGMVAGGCLMALTGACMPLIGKERSADKSFNAMLIGVGGVLAMLGVGGFFGLQYYAYTKIQATSYYPDPNLGISFYMAAGASVLAFVALFPQLAKIEKKEEKKPKAEFDPSMDPDLANLEIDPALL